MDNNIALVIPTYNEKENIVKMIEMINALTLPIDILVVDDNSPDGTGRLVDSLKKEVPNISIIHRKEKKGLGPAYLDGFNKVRFDDRYKYAVQMDADFSHDPKDIGRLVNTLKEMKCDVTVGSRYVKGGGVSDKWSFFRKFISRFGNFYANIVTGLKIKDCTSGFKAYRTEALRAMDFNTISLSGYGFQIQLLQEATRKNFKICEVPIYFDERAVGKSKMNYVIIWEAFFVLAVISLKEKLLKRKNVILF